MSAVFSELQSLAPSAIIELFQLELNAAQHGVNETYRFHAGVNQQATGNIVWAGQEYLRFPIEASEFEYNGQGQLPRPKLRASNIMGTITALLLTLPNGLEGAKVTRIRTLARYLDGGNFPGGTNPLGTPDPNAEFPREVYFIDRKAVETRDVIEFELSCAFDLAGVRAPKRQCISNICQWKYRSAECGYTGNAYFDANDNPVSSLSQDVCGKRLKSCEARFSQIRRQGTVTTGSNILTLTQASSFSTGDPVSGFGLPGGTTVQSVNGAQVTLSQNAVATSSLSRTGTIQSNYSQIALSSAAGIIPGVNVTGSFLQANTQVVGVSGNTVTLSAAVDPAQFFTAVSTFSGSIYGNDRRSILADVNASAVVGQFIASATLPLSRRARISEIRYILLTAGKTSTRYKVVILDQAVADTRGVTWTTYTENTIPSATYSFSSTNNTYTFRADNPVPYGSFPGIGAYAI